MAALEAARQEEGMELLVGPGSPVKAAEARPAAAITVIDEGSGETVYP